MQQQDYERTTVQNNLGELYEIEMEWKDKEQNALISITYMKDYIQTMYPIDDDDDDQKQLIDWKTRCKAKSYTELANIYKQLHGYDLAIQYLTVARNICRSTN